MNAAKLREMSSGDLQNELTSLLREQFNLRMQQASGEMKKPHLANKVQKNIARVYTVITENKKAGKI